MELRPIAPSLLVARATQMAADSVGAIDQQVAAARAIRIDASVLPSLAAHVASLNGVLAQWPDALRARVIDTVQRAIAFDDGIAEAWATVPRDDAGRLLDFARVLQAGLAAQDDAARTLGGQVGGFRAAVDAAVSQLQTDCNAVSARLAAEQQLAASLEAQVAREQARIDDYRKHPWKLVLAGLTLPTLIMELTQIIDASKQASAALSRLREVEGQLGQLAAARGPLLQLSLAMTGLGGGVSNMRTALDQMANDLGAILDQPPLPPIIAAQLQTMMQDLASARAIAAELGEGA